MLPLLASFSCLIKILFILQGPIFPDLSKPFTCYSMISESFKACCCLHLFAFALTLKEMSVLLLPHPILECHVQGNFQAAVLLKGPVVYKRLYKLFKSFSSCYLICIAYTSWVYVIIPILQMHNSTQMVEWPAPSSIMGEWIAVHGQEQKQICSSWRIHSPVALFFPTACVVCHHFAIFLKLCFSF